MSDGQLVRYDAMLVAIAECHRVDELKDMRDKAAALEMYARQARNTEAERKACDVRLRAERRAGQLLKELARGEPGRPTEKVPTVRTNSAYSRALADTGISSQTASRYQQLANVPAAVFEQHMADPIRKPTTTALIQAARDPQPAAQMPAQVLRFWGALRDLERLGFFDMRPGPTFDQMTETMREDVLRLLPMAIRLYTRFEEELHEPA